MYHTLSIDQLSKKQVSKLLNGHPVRVKMGSGGKIHVTSEQAKKMNRAALKGCAITLTLDPYAIQNNQHLRDAVGMLRKLGVLKGGTALIDQPFTVRQAVNSTGNFFKDPGGTMGFGFEGPLPSPDKSAIPAGLRPYRGQGNRVPPIPTQYRGRGSYPPRGIMKGDGFWEDVGSVVKNVGKKAAKAISNEVVQYAGPAAGAAFAAAATASGNPEFAPAAAALGNQLGAEAGQYVNKKIQGMGGKRRKRGGTALIDQPFTVRQAVNSTGNFFKDPGGTMGFGGTLLIDEPITARQVVNTTGKFFKNPAKTLGFGARKRRGKGFVEELAKVGNKLMPVLEALKPQYNDYGVGDAVARSVGLGVKNPKRVMSEAQKAALAKGRHALRIRLNEMGAGAKRKAQSGKSLMPAGYGV